MTPTLHKRIWYGLVGLTLAFTFLGHYMSNSSSANTASLNPAVAAATPVPTPTKLSYNCGDYDNPDYIRFKWTARRPNGGWVGEVTYGSFVNKPIQVYDVKKTYPDRNDLNWGFQAQDGSFVCRIFVTELPQQKVISFGQCRNNVWPQPICVRPRIGIETPEP